jgi:hypothetical protein
MNITFQSWRSYLISFPDTAERRIIVDGVTINNIQINGTTNQMYKQVINYIATQHNLNTIEAFEALPFNFGNLSRISTPSYNTRVNNLDIFYYYTDTKTKIEKMCLLCNHFNINLLIGITYKDNNYIINNNEELRVRQVEQQLTTLQNTFNTFINHPFIQSFRSLLNIIPQNQ